MSESSEAPLVNDAITSDEAGFVSDAGEQTIGEAVAEASEESAEESAEAASEESSEASEEGVKAETKEELKEEVQEALENGASEEEVKDMIREFTLKVNGKEKQVKVDLNNEADLIRRLQLAEASQIAMQEKRELEKSYEEEVKKLLENPFGTLEEMGLDPLKLAEERIRAEVEERKKSPEIRERERIEKELAEARAKLKEQEEAAKNAQRAQLEAEEASKLENEIEEALDSYTKLPNTPQTVARIADHLLWAIENAEDMGIDPDDITVRDVLPSVEEEYYNEIQSLMSSMPAEMMEQYIGKQNLEKMRKERLNTMKTNNVSNVKPTTKSVKAEGETKKTKKVSSKEYFKNL